VQALEPTLAAEMSVRYIGNQLGVLGTVNGVAKFISIAAVCVIWTHGFAAARSQQEAGMMLAGTLVLLRVRNAHESALKAR
jgi:hypothetical protein